VKRSRGREGAAHFADHRQLNLGVAQIAEDIEVPLEQALRFLNLPCGKKPAQQLKGGQQTPAFYAEGMDRLY
jgi:hypothetical protein